MKDRRSFLETIGTTTAVGLASSQAGCLGILGGGGSSTPLDAAFVVDPNLAPIFESRSASQGSSAEVTYYDVEGLSEYEAHVSDWAAQSVGAGAATNFTGTDGVESVEQTVDARYTSTPGDSLFAMGRVGLLEGSVDAARYAEQRGFGDPTDSYRGHDLYLDAEAPAAVGSDRVASAILTRYQPESMDAAEESTLETFATGLLQRALDRSGDRPSPHDWVAHAMDQCRPYHSCTVSVRQPSADDSSEPSVTVEAFRVEGETTRMLYAVGRASAAAHEDNDDRRAAVSQVDPWTDDDPDVTTTDTATVAAITLQTENTFLGNRD